MGIYENLIAWSGKNAPWFGYIIMAVFGGIVAHLREWEKNNPDMSVKQHVLALTRRATMAVLAGLIWFFIMQQNNWQSQPYAYVGASLVGMFAPEFFDWLWDLLKQRVGRAAGGTTGTKP